jgi:transcriptional regulator with XRE-family HTH domain
MKKPITKESAQAFCADFAKTLRDERISQGITQEQLANWLQIDRSVLAKMETMQNSFSMEKVIRWADALNHKINLKNGKNVK